MSTKKTTKARKPGPVPKRKPVTSDPASTLTADQVKFMEHLLAGFSVPEAYDRVGIQPNTAYDWLKRVDFQIVLEQQREILRKTLGIERDRIVLEHCRIAFTNAADFFEARENGGFRVRDPAEWTPGMRASVKEIEVFEEWGGVGDDRVLYGFTKKIKFHDKQKALDALAKMIGVDAAPKAPVGPDGKPVQQIAGYIVVPAKDAIPDAKPGDVIEGHLANVRGKSG